MRIPPGSTHRSTTPRHKLLGRGLLLVLVGAAPRLAAETGDFSANGLLAVGVQDSQGGRSWSEAGLGRYLGKSDDGLQLQAHLGLLWQHSLDWSVSAHLRADNRGSGDGVQTVGLVEASVSRHFFLADDARLSLRLGQIFLPSTQEAIDPLWQSRYTLTLSSLNSWVAEEIRPIGLDLGWQSAPDSDYESALGAMLFGGNDSAGSLLAWRGFSLHDRLAVRNETVPLPALPSLQDPAQFGDQNDDGTRPIGRDLDSRVGYALHGRWGRSEHWRLVGSWFDNRGDRRLHRGEYAWDTRFAILGGHWRPHSDWDLAAEWLRGSSGMGSRSGPIFVDIDFSSAYVLASWSASPYWRLSLRADHFSIVDRDHSAAENNDDRGNAVTLAGFYSPTPQWRLGLEFIHSDSEHAAAASIGLPTETAGDSLRIEARYSF